jgi:nucleoredoxin
MVHPMLLSPFALFVSTVTRLGPRHTTSYPFVSSSYSSSSATITTTTTTTKMQAFSLVDSAAVLLDQNGETFLQGETLANRLHRKQVALYFAAGWCPMCTRFEPALLQFREKAAGTPLEIIYVSSDRSATDQAKRVAALHMLSIPFGATAELKKQYRIWSGSESGMFGTGRRSGVPALVVLDRDGQELAFLAAEAKGAAALRDWPLDDPRAVWGG